MALILLRICAFLYVGAVGWTLWHVLRPREETERRSMTVLLIALIGHAVAIGGRTVEMEAFPMAGLHDALSVFAFMCGLIAFAVALRGQVPHVAWLATPIVATLVVIAAMLEPSVAAPEALRSPMLALHIGLALSGDAAFVVAGVASALFLAQERRLRQRKKEKRRRPGVVTGLNTLPALDRLDSASAALFKGGFPLMTLGIITGAVYAQQVWGRFWHWDPRNTVSLLVWAMYAVMLYMRLTIGWRGRRAAKLTVFGVVLILLTFVGLSVAGGDTHLRSTEMKEATQEISG